MLFRHETVSIDSLAICERDTALSKKVGSKRKSKDGNKKKCTRQNKPDMRKTWRFFFFFSFVRLLASRCVCVYVCVIEEKKFWRETCYYGNRPIPDMFVIRIIIFLLPFFFFTKKWLEESEMWENESEPIEAERM